MVNLRDLILFSLFAALASSECLSLNASEACLGRDVDFLGDPCSPDCFYTCKSTTGDDSRLSSETQHDSSFTAVRRCCAHCLLWSQMELTCLPNLVTPECQNSNATTNSTDTSVQCDLLVGPTLYTFINNGTLMHCSVGSSYNASLCSCQHDESNPLEMDTQVTCITFSTGWNNLQGSNGAYIQSSEVEPISDSRCHGHAPCGYFNSTEEAYMSIPLFCNSMDAYDQFSVSLKATRYSNHPGTQGLVNNGNCGWSSSLDILTSPGTLYVIGRNTEDQTAESGPITVADDVEFHLVVTFDGTSLAVYLDNGLVWAAPLQGKLKRTYLPVVIGSSVCQPEEFFEGVMDTISFAKVAFSPLQIQDLYENSHKCLPN